MKMNFSTKHMQINKANNMMFIVVAIASVVTVFSLMSTKALLSQSAYQRKVLAERNKAVKALKSNISAANSLVTQYNAFENANPNMLGGVGGNNPGTGATDGDNARIVLDALPSQYDFPALVSSLEKIVTLNGMSVEGIGGTDAGSAQNSASTSTTTTTASATAAPVPINFSVNLTSNYSNIQKLISSFEHSIRPFDITAFSLSGNEQSMSVNASAVTYYQPASGLQIGEKVVK